MSLLPTRPILAIAHTTASRIEAHLDRQGLKVNFAGLPPAKLLGFLHIAVLARRFNLSDIAVFENYRRAYAAGVAEYGQRSPLGLRLGTLLSKSAFFRVLDSLERLQQELASEERLEQAVQVNRPVTEQGGMLRVMLRAEDPGTLLQDHTDRVIEFRKRKIEAAKARPYRRNPWL